MMWRKTLYANNLFFPTHLHLDLPNELSHERKEIWNLKIGKKSEATKVRRRDILLRRLSAFSQLRTH